MNHVENDQQVQGSAGEETEASCTYCDRAPADSERGSGDNHMRVPVPRPRGELCTSAACLNERNTWREGT